MAQITRSQANFMVLQDDFSARRQEASAAPPSPSLALDSTSAALGELSVDQSQNKDYPADIVLELLAANLQHLHIHDTEKGEQHVKPAANTRGFLARPSIDTETFVAPRPETMPAPERVSREQREKALEDTASTNCRPLALASSNTPPNKHQLHKHLAGQFEWVLSLPAADISSKGHRHTNSSDDVVVHPGGRNIYFGCNLLRQRSRSAGGKSNENHQSANTYTLIATPIEGHEEPPASPQRTEELTMEDAVADVSVDTPAGKATDAPQITINEIPHELAECAYTDSDSSSAEIITHQPSPTKPCARIEDSFEAIDQLEEQLEALGEVTNFGRAAPPEERKKTQDDSATPSSGKKTTLKRATAAAGTKPAARKAVSIQEDGEDDRAAKSTPKRTPVPRPASLQTPRALAKSSKPPTKPAFELPGEAVARRLKEQREARLNQQGSPETPAATFTPVRKKSTKPLTRPTFELPGEAISRRKREQQEAKLKAQQEEERKRREFKAKPVRASIVPSTYPRETIASRARQAGKTVMAENAARDSVETTSPGKRGTDLAGNRPPLTATANSQPRGRGSAGTPSAAPSLSRATSTSTGSVGRKRSTMSAEELQQQRLRAKEILQRDNQLSEEREKERRERETAARLARAEAAERSRQLSREWAEKQKRRVSVAPVGSDAEDIV